MVKKDSSLFRRVFRAGILFLLLLPLAVTLFLSTPAAIFDYLGQSYQNNLLLIAAQLLAVLSDVLRPALLTAAYVILGYSLFRFGRGPSFSLLIPAILSPLALSLLGFALNYLLAVVGLSVYTPSAFLARLNPYLLSLALEYAAEMLLLLLCYLLFQGRLEKEKKKTQGTGFEKKQPLFAKGEAYFSVCRITLLLRILTIGVARAVDVISDFQMVLTAAEVYGVVSGQAFLSLFTVVILPILYLLLSIFAMRQATYIAGERLDELFLSEPDSRQ